MVVKFKTFLLTSLLTWIDLRMYVHIIGSIAFNLFEDKGQLHWHEPFYSDCHSYVLALCHSYVLALCHTLDLSYVLVLMDSQTMCLLRM